MLRGRRRWFARGLVAVVATGGALVAAAAPATAAQAKVVLPGNSIQAAIDSAGPGGTVIVKPGVYHENLVITQNNLTLKSNGAQLRPSEEPAESPCDQGGGDGGGGNDLTTAQETGPVTGICVAGGTAPVKSVRIEGFDIADFTNNGIMVFNGKNTTIIHNTLVNDGEYGVFALQSSGTRIDGNRAQGNGEAGFYVGESEHANADVVNNEASDNGFGVFLRSSQHGTVKNNNIHDNCVGILVLADAPGPAGQYHVSFNNISDNNKLCPANGEQDFDLQGIGILMLGSHGMEVHSNDVNENRSELVTVPFSGGLVLASGVGGTPPTKNRITRNDAFENLFDIVWDGTGTKNTLAPNTCALSVPSGFCTL